MARANKPNSSGNTSRGWDVYSGHLAQMTSAPKLTTTPACKHRPNLAFEHDGTRHYGWNRFVGGRWTHWRIQWSGPGVYREASPNSWWPAGAVDGGRVMQFETPHDVVAVQARRLAQEAA